MKMHVKLDTQSITQEQVKALKKADYLVFQYQDGESIIRVGKVDKRTRKNEELVIIDCGTILYNPRSEKEGEIIKAVHLESDVKYNQHIKTIISRIKKDDVLILKWRANNNSDLLSQAGLYRDELYLIISRPNGKKEEYLIAVTITSNNLAKMIQNESTSIPAR